MHSSPLYHQYPLPIKKEKAEDVKKLLSRYVRSKDQCFYSDLAVNTESGSDTATFKTPH